MSGDVIDLSTRLNAEIAKSKMTDPATLPCRFSTLKLFAQSPLHYWYGCQNQFEETLSMRVGSGAHALLFNQPYVVWNGKVRNGAKWDAFESDHAGKVILNQRELEQSRAMADAIRSHETASRLLFTPGTIHEQRIDWEWQGRAFRSTPDAYNRTTLVDLKCLRSAEPDKVMWQSSKMFYHCQAALYRRCLNSLSNSVKDAYLVVVENRPPHPVSVFRFTETALEAGDRACALWLEQLRACEQSGVYPGYTQTIVDLELPGDGMDAFTFEGDEESSDG